MSSDAFPAHESTRKRRRWGCTCGCVFVLIFLVVGGALFTYYTLRPLKPYSRYAMIDTAVNGFGVIRLDSSDDGQSDFIKLVFKRAEMGQKAQLSESDAKLWSLFLKVVRQFITSLVQTDNLIHLAYDPATSKESVLGVVPLRNRFSYLLAQRFVKENISSPAEKVAGCDIYPLGTDKGTTTSVLSVSARDLVLSDNPEMMRRSLKYVADPERIAEPSERLQQYIDELALDQPPAGEDLAIAIINEEGRFGNFLRVLERSMANPGLSQRVEEALAAEKVSLSEIQGAKLTADLMSADKLKAEVVMYCRQSDHATRLANILKQAVSQISGKREGSSIELKADVRTRGANVVIGFEIAGLKKWIELSMPVAASTEPETAK